MSKSLGIAATGHAQTSHAAAEILRAGGNAYDAAIAALCAACVAEPLMASLGGGGFLLSLTGTGKTCVHDFFCQTPMCKKPTAEMDFFPINADFGTDTQEFHVGMGAMAVPGLVAGIFQIHRDLGRIPMIEIMQPAVELARKGVRIDPLNHYVVRILEAILTADKTLFGLFESPSRRGELIRDGEIFRNPDLANTFEQLARYGEEFFYQGEWAHQLSRDSQDRGGNLTLEDLSRYRVELRKPLGFDYRGTECLINPPPSPGGCLIAYALGLLTDLLVPGGQWGERAHTRAVVQALHGASLARAQSSRDLTELEDLLGTDMLSRWRDEIQWHSLFSRGTTHISVADAEGNIASLTASNGEGNTYVLPGTGIILNNMLGEEDLNPGGFHRWREDSRLASMMSPMIARHTDGSLLALGSGGSNRIRSAIMQVLVNILDFDLPLSAAVNAPRLHLEAADLSVEAGFSATVLQDLGEKFASLRQWPTANLFFGGVHSVRRTASGKFEGAGDPRRNGVVEIA